MSNNINLAWGRVVKCGYVESMLQAVLWFVSQSNFTSINWFYFFCHFFSTGRDQKVVENFLSALDCPPNRWDPIQTQTNLFICMQVNRCRTFINSHNILNFLNPVELSLFLNITGGTHCSTSISFRRWRESGTIKRVPFTSSSFHLYKRYESHD